MPNWQARPAPSARKRANPGEIVKVVDFGQTQHGLLYIVMDYVEGPSLVTLIDDGAMAPARVVLLARGNEEDLAIEHLSRALALAPEIRSLLPGFAEFQTLLESPLLLTADD